MDNRIVDYNEDTTEKEKNNLVIELFSTCVIFGPLLFMAFINKQEASISKTKTRMSKNEFIKTSWAVLSPVQQ